jgi:hypothetical protein
MPFIRQFAAGEISNLVRSSTLLAVLVTTD